MADLLLGDTQCKHHLEAVNWIRQGIEKYNFDIGDHIRISVDVYLTQNLCECMLSACERKHCTVN